MKKINKKLYLEILDSIVELHLKDFDNKEYLDKLFYDSAIKYSSHDKIVNSEYPVFDLDDFTVRKDSLKDLVSIFNNYIQEHRSDAYSLNYNFIEKTVKEMREENYSDKQIKDRLNFINDISSSSYKETLEKRRQKEFEELNPKRSKIIKVLDIIFKDYLLLTVGVILLILYLLTNE